MPRRRMIAPVAPRFDATSEKISRKARQEAQERFAKMPDMLSAARSDEGFGASRVAINQFIAAMANIYTPKTECFWLCEQLFIIAAEKARSSDEVEEVFHLASFMNGSMFSYALWTESRLGQRFSAFRSKAADIARRYVLYAQTIPDVSLGRDRLRSHDIRDHTSESDDVMCARKIVWLIRTKDDALSALHILQKAQEFDEWLRERRETAICSEANRIRQRVFCEELSRLIALRIVAGT